MRCDLLPRVGQQDSNLRCESISRCTRSAHLCKRPHERSWRIKFALYAAKPLRPPCILMHADIVFTQLKFIRGSLLCPSQRSSTEVESYLHTSESVQEYSYKQCPWTLKMCSRTSSSCDVSTNARPDPRNAAAHNP